MNVSGEFQTHQESRSSERSYHRYVVEYVHPGVCFDAITRRVFYKHTWRQAQVWAKMYEGPGMKVFAIRRCDREVH